MPAIGIDLGTTNCCVAVYRNGRAEVIANNHGNRTTPSFVAFNDTETLYGEPALNELPRNSQNTVYEIKRLIGRTFSECEEQIDLKQFPFKVSANDNNMPEITVEQGGQQTKYTPQQLSAMLLTQMKKVAEALLDERVTDAVITVPANFNNNQREATKEAAELAGLNVLRLVNEPTAAALAYGLEGDLSRQTQILIFDVGGGTFDVSILTAENGDYKVLSTAGDTKLGGAEFVNRMVKHLTNKIWVEHGKDLNESCRSRVRLRMKCEKAKCDLSFTEEAHIEMDDLMAGVHLDTTVRRYDFNRLNMDLFDHTLHIVNNALDEAKLTKNDIDHVVLVGGSTRIVKLRTMLEAFFGGKELKYSINPDEAVACGAALLAANLSGAQIDSSTNIRLADVIPLSLGLDNAQDMMVTIVPRNTPVPFEGTRNFVSSKDNHTASNIRILEGERARAEDNRTIGFFRVEMSTPRQYHEPTFTVKFNVDANGILKVTVIDRRTGEIIHTNNITDNGRLSHKEIQNMISEAKNERETDQLYHEQAKAKRMLNKHVYQIKHQLEDGKFCRCESDRKKLLDHCKELIVWLGDESLKDISQYRSKQEQFDKLCASMKAPLQCCLQ